MDKLQTFTGAVLLLCIASAITMLTVWFGIQLFG